MLMIFGKPLPLLFGQLLLGIINGSFYAMLSMGLAIIFGLLRIINFAHGALFMVGAFVTWGLLTYLSLDFWWALFLAPVIVGAFGLLLERTLIRRIYKLDILYGLLLTFGLALILQGGFTNYFGSSGVSYNAPDALSGVVNLGFMYLPVYRGFVIFAAILVCGATWFLIEKTRLGALLRAATANPGLVQSFGVNVPRLIALTFAFGVGLAGLAGVLAAPLYSVNPNMGSDLINTVFAVVVIGGMGSIGGAILSGFALGIIEGFTDVFYPPGSAVVVFVVMAIVLLARPAGLFGKLA
ncbi:MAG TPA: branched-chain amino acid ABC transporter permease [Acidocella sp.]|jgi:branched-chain amino acid transport system permease protein|uniref:branched-chain amino acid ABC transporter permease n=1 Tax=Acidocella sp. TaxID=50710 RepID=UPI002B525B8B|nr:branched-chain amino acid ABC transporter permease [Acidocella sp.]HVE21915.1 branched-chain amino acid ABC transporter permease [Acidocella sp.]